MEYTAVYSDEYLYHHGIKGQKWGVRNYQNPDGSLTEEGRIRYGVGEHKKFFTPNVKEQAAERGKRGAKVGAVVYGTIGLVGATALVATLPPAVLAANPATIAGLAAFEVGASAVEGAARIGMFNYTLGAINAHNEDKAVRKQYGR